MDLTGSGTASSSNVSVGGARQRHGPRPVEVRLHDKANEGSHRDTAVLDLCLTQKSNRRLLRLAPELHLGERRRVVIAQRRVELLCQHHQVSLRFHANRCANIRGNGGAGEACGQGHESEHNGLKNARDEFRRNVEAFPHDLIRVAHRFTRVHNMLEDLSRLSLLSSHNRNS
jgi:hypothetical protein